MSQFSDPAIILFLYSNLKNFFMYRLFPPAKNLRAEFTLAGTFLLSLVNMLLYWYLTQDYVSHLNLSFMKGSIDLPPFHVLFIGLDLVISVIFIIIALIQHYHAIPGASLGYEIFRITIFFAIFPALISVLWMNSFQEKFANLNYPCFQAELRRDIVNYYEVHRLMPKSMAEASTHTINPFNKSPLRIDQPEKAYLFSVLDEAGNVIISPGSFIGFDGVMNQETLENHKRINEMLFENYCLSQ